MNISKSPAQATAYDAIVVLAGGVNPKGEIPGFVKRRVDTAIAVSDSKIPVIMTGRWSFLISYTPPKSEAQAMKTYALLSDPRLRSRLVMAEDESMDTIGNAYYTKVGFLEPHQWHNILLITSDFHLARATYIFQKVLGSGYSITSLATKSGYAPEELRAKAMVEKKILDFTQQLLEPIKDGESEEVHAVMNLFTGYSTTPKYTQAELLAILDIGAPVVDAYGINAADS